MGIIKAVTTAIGSGFADQWLEVIEPGDVGEGVVFSKGVLMNRKNSNRKRTPDTISDGSVIHVYPNQMMILSDGGKVIDYTAEEGYYKVSNGSMPSLFNGQFGESLKESFQRIRYGGSAPSKQQVFYVNLAEVKGIKFGTVNPVNYFDAFYNAELFLRCFGTYSIKVTDPLKFYAQVIPKDAETVRYEDIAQQYQAEFMQALQASINQMSADGERISFVTSRANVLSQYMQSSLDMDWNQNRGFEVDHVGIASITYDESSKALIDMRNKGAMMGDPNIREGYVQTEIAEGLKAAGANSAGAGTAFMGVGLGMQAGGSFIGAASQTNLEQMRMQQAAAGAGGQSQAYGTPAPGGAAGQGPAGQQTSQAPQPGPTPGIWFCPKDGTRCDGNFCPLCGTRNPFLS